MPRGDGTGPSGDGRPGRGLGPCGNNKMSDKTNKGNMRGTNRGNRRGQGGKGMNRGSGKNQ